MDRRITLDKFQTLPKNEQFGIVFNLGDFLEAKTEGKLQAIIYAVDDFFVKLCFDPKVIKIIKVSAFNRE